MDSQESIGHKNKSSNINNNPLYDTENTSTHFFSYDSTIALY